MNADKKGFFAVLTPEQDLFPIQSTAAEARAAVARTGPAFEQLEKEGCSLVELLPVPVLEDTPLNVYLISGRRKRADDDICGLYTAANAYQATACFLSELFTIPLGEALTLLDTDEGDDQSYYIVTGPNLIGTLRGEGVLQLSPGSLT